MMESDILHAAAESLEKLAHAHVEIDQKAQTNGYHWDALIDIRAGNTKERFLVEVKNHVTPVHLARMMDRLRGKDGLLVSKHFSASVIELLEAENINYLDVAGNCLIHSDGGLFLRIKGQKLPEEFREIKHKAFSKNGIKLIHGLLLEENLINEPYRTMATKTAISGSTVGSVLEDLTNSKFLYQLNATTKLIANKKDLLSQWVAAYNQKLRRKLIRGKYRFLNQPTNWKNFDLGKTAFWGGEPAAGLLTNYLHPEIWTIYTNLDRKALMKEFQLVPDMKHGKVEVLELFWNAEDEKFIVPNLQTVNPLLVYADLIGSGNGRNLETANRIYEQYLKNIIEQSNG